jgi:uncharacterized protein YutE (UPF0331/DUF86 family)
VTDVELVHKKLAFIETCVRELRTLAHPDDVRTDIREQRFEAHTLQIAIQAALDVAAHIASDELLGEPETNRALFEALAQHGWIPAELLPTLRGMVGFRNILVHGYETVDPEVIEQVVRRNLDDLLAYVRAIRERLASA